VDDHRENGGRKNPPALFLRRDEDDQDSQNVKKAGQEKSLKKKLEIAALDEIRQIEKIFRKCEKKTDEYGQFHLKVSRGNFQNKKNKSSLNDFFHDIGIRKNFLCGNEKQGGGQCQKKKRNRDKNIINPFVHKMILIA
jgi:hypothetical protein